MFSVFFSRLKNDRQNSATKFLRSNLPGRMCQSYAQEFESNFITSGKFQIENAILYFALTTLSSPGTLLKFDISVMSP